MKCQSNRFESDTGCAQKWGEGEGDDSESSAASFINRRMVGDMVFSLLMWRGYPCVTLWSRAGSSCMQAATGPSSRKRRLEKVRN